MTILDLPSMPGDAPPVILPGLLTGLGITKRATPGWITDPNLIASIQAGLMDLPDEFAGDA
ncbi:hypothetical protein M2155_000670 [Streptomyces sp. SAI-119]|uniref:hypothetical protein n=1 Tax=Streptomyces sp. SAI-119 TaxID=2940541 RepID=UPI002476552D|nr:hypothetical protein [Streptomyces sp. SAI-119]MDH6448262.1 hypothetical protein [Streptomyces sp. SAI-119]